MNVFFVIILLALIGEYALGLVANVMNLRTLRLEAPLNLKDVYKPEEYKRSQLYTYTNTCFEIVTDSIKLLILITFWFVNGFNFLDQLVRGWGFNSVVTGLLYFSILLFFYMLLTLPFSIYGTFVIEQRFGFNKTVVSTFFLDRVKVLGLTVLFGCPLLVAVLIFFEHAGKFGWLYGWGVVSLFSLTMVFIFPTWIMPIFNRFNPMESGGLKDAIFRYAESVEFEIQKIFVMDGSKRSSKSNAFFSGFGRNRRIALFDTLVDNHTVPELVAVLAHEIGHYKKKHVYQNIIVSIVHTGVVFFLLSIVLGSDGLYEAFFMEKQSTYAGLLFFGLLFTPIEVILSVVMHMVSRKHEYEADRWAVETVDDPRGLVTGLKKLSSDNLSNMTPHPFYVFLNYSHPPLAQRVSAIELQIEVRMSDRS